MILEAPGTDLSREDTTRIKASYLAQLPLDARPGSRAWVRQSLRLRVAESTPDRRLVADVVRRRHYLQRWPVPPKTLILSYLATLAGVEAGPAGTGGMVMIALLAGQYHALKALDVHPCSALQLVRNYRADDMGPDVAPDFMPQILRRVVSGCRRSGLRPLAEEWTTRKCRADGLYAAPRLLLTYADPGVGHDGGLYRGAGARYLGAGAQGRLLFGWPLVSDLVEPLRQLEAAVSERAAQERTC